MFDENDCINCGKSLSSKSLYCSEKCRLQDCGDASASNSNSSVAPSSASSSPSRASSNLGRTKQRTRTTTGQDALLLQRHSRTSSNDSSPSLHTSDLPDYSEDDVEIETTVYEAKGRSAAFQTNPFRTTEKAMDHAFWKSRYADVGGKTPTTLDRDTATSGGGGSKSVPGTANALHYVRKPGPINVAINPATSKLASGLSSYKSSHKRFGSEYGYPTGVKKMDSKGRLKASEPPARQGSAESATSSTPRSKSNVALSSSVTKLQTTASESTLSTSVTRPATASAAGTMRHVSDTMVHTLRRAIVPFTTFEQPTEPPAPATHQRASLRTDSMALAALKDVARSHGMIDSRAASQQAHKEAAVGQRRHHHTDKSNVSSLDQGASSTIASNSSHSSSGHLQNSHSSHDSEGVAYDDDDPQEKGGRGRSSRKRQTLSRSPSPPSWASWAEDEPINHRRGRSARRGQ